MKKLNLLLMAAVLLIGGAGCSFLRQEPLPQVPGTPLGKQQVSAVQGGLRGVDSALNSLKALLQVRITHGEKSARMRYAVVFVKPDRLRLEALPASGAYTLGLLIAQDGKVTLLDPVEKEARVGAAGAGLVQQMLGLPLTEQDLVSYLSGRLPAAVTAAMADPSKFKLYHDARAGAHSLVEGGFRGYWVFSDSTYDLRQVQLRDKLLGRMQLQLLYGRQQRYGSLQLPTQIRVLLPRNDIQIDLVFSAVDVNGIYPDRLFEVKIPEDFEVIDAG